MTRDENLSAAIIELANSKAERGTPVSLLDIGPSLVVERAFTQDEVVNALHALQADGVIRLLEGNRVLVLL
ncbi:hypothetical protein [Rhizobium grahamii]|uniref:DprA winged helix domain-containing protein n=1 Tax=Rhizobium grahamii TaxID=1120045 RepID=A0A370KHV8_9HYPH|nr:hypothetical protein [Rhizobium grahamii]RDJ05268.1 hypothetical protein B5K06_25980 [Rhizobium grahamii]